MALTQAPPAVDRWDVAEEATSQVSAAILTDAHGDFLAYPSASADQDHLTWGHARAAVGAEPARHQMPISIASYARLASRSSAAPKQDVHMTPAFGWFWPDCSMTSHDGA